MASFWSGLPKWLRNTLYILAMTAAAAGYRIYSETIGPANNERIQQQEAEVRKALPLKVDAITTMIDVKFEGKKSSYWYVINAPSNDIDIARVASALRQKACSNPVFVHTINEDGYTYIYHYHTSSGEALPDISLSRCP